MTNSRRISRGPVVKKHSNKETVREWDRDARGKVMGSRQLKRGTENCCSPLVIPACPSGKLSLKSVFELWGCSRCKVKRSAVLGVCVCVWGGGGGEFENVG